MMIDTVLPASVDDAPATESAPFWLSLSPGECEILYMEAFLKFQPEEAALFRRKWFDYRFEHPLISTYRFAQAYREAYRYITAVRFDREQAKYVKGFSGEDILKLKPQSRTGFIRARMTADALGVPYDFWCNESMRFAEKMSWANMPRPFQLYSEAIVEHVCVAWAREQEVAVRRAAHPNYAPERDCNNADQRDYQQYLLAAVKSSTTGAQPWRLASMLDALTPASLSEFSLDTLREAQRLRAIFSQS